MSELILTAAAMYAALQWAGQYVTIRCHCPQESLGCSTVTKKVQGSPLFPLGSQRLPMLSSAQSGPGLLTPPAAAPRVSIGRDPGPLGQSQPSILSLDQSGQSLS